MAASCPAGFDVASLRAQVVATYERDCSQVGDEPGGVPKQTRCDLCPDR
jgi:hypothetical protein